MARKAKAKTKKARKAKKGTRARKTKRAGPPKVIFRPQIGNDKDLYALGKLAEAVDALVIGAGRVQERLAEAAICLVSIRPDEIPEDLRGVFIGVKDDLHFEPAQGGEGRIAATMRITGDEDASAIAHRILELYLEHDRRAERELDGLLE